MQGVGFRPFVFRLAEEMKLKGWVMNNTQGVFLEAEAEPEVLQEFLRRIQSEKPAIASIQSFEYSYLDPVSYATFEIRESEDGAKTALILPDIATCPECLREIFDPLEPAVSLSRSPTAPIAGRASALSKHCRTIARARRCGSSRCA